MIRIMNHELRIMHLILVALFMLLASIFIVKPVSAATCPGSGTKVPSNQQLGDQTATNHLYTGQPCGALRNSDGSIVGPAEYLQINDASICRGACTYQVTYCTPGADSCEVTYQENNCANAPAQCANPGGGTSAIGNVFGKIRPPNSIIDLGFGASGIGKFLSNLIRLIYSLAGVAFIFMIIWGAWDWITSEGNKEKLDSARNKIMNAIIGILIFAAAFAIISVLGKFTGFTFFK